MIINKGPKKKFHNLQRLQRFRKKIMAKLIQNIDIYELVNSQKAQICG